MGLKRYAKHKLLPGSRLIDTIKNVSEEGDFLEGVKRTIKEEYAEDNPLTSAIYKSGKHDGKIEGYEEASDEYEQKLLDLADKFLNQTRIYEDERDAYEELLDKYEAEIDRLVAKNNKTEVDNLYLNQLIIRDRKLRKIEG